MKSSFKDADVYIPQTNGAISDSLIKNWTLQALECYKIKGVCKKCSIDKSKYSFVCQMPKVIRELVQNNIRPPKELQEIMT